MVIWKKQNEESLKETKALPHWIVMGASISKLSTTEQRTPSKQNKTKPTNNATINKQGNPHKVISSLFSRNSASQKGVA